jgi:hypothetical protein
MTTRFDEHLDSGVPASPEGAGEGEAAWDGGSSAQEQCREALEHLSAAAASGQEWPSALLEAMGLWTVPEEVYQGRLYRYLLQGEAFDWLLLARRLVREADGLIPPADRRRLLRQGHLPARVSREEFRRLIGVPKFRAHLNYWYGVTVEAALQEALRDEVRKEKVNRGFSPRTPVTAEAFRRIYGETRAALMARFAQEWQDPVAPLAPGGFVKEFTYWMFKQRIQQIEKARVASDTRKGLEWLSRRQQEALLWQATAPGLDTSARTSAEGTRTGGGDAVEGPR